MASDTDRPGRLPDSVFVHPDPSIRTYRHILPGSVLPHPLTSRLELIERLAFDGLSRGQIAKELKVSLAVLADAEKHFEDVRLAITGGQAQRRDVDAKLKARQG